MLLYFVIKKSYNNLTVVDFPFEPVIPIIGDFVNQDANSISLIIGISVLFNTVFIILLSGFIPGLLMIISFN